MSVSTKPGATTFAVMLRLPSSRAIERARPDQPGLAGRVVGLAGRAEQPDDGGHEDHPAAAGADHLGAGPLGHPVGGGEVRVEDLGEVLLLHAHQQPVAGDPGVADQHLDRALVLLDLGERAVDGLGVGDVALHAEQAVGRAAAAVRDRDRVALLGEGAGDRQPDPPVAAGHQHRSAHVPLPCAGRCVVSEPSAVGAGHTRRGQRGGRDSGRDQRFRPQVGQAPGPWAASTFSATAICWLPGGQVGARRVLRSTERQPGR